MIPALILVFGAILSVFGFLIGIVGYLKPGLAFANIQTDTPPVKLVVRMLSGRNIAMGTVMALALISGSPQILTVAFAMRLLTEIQDTAALVSSRAMNVPPVALIAGFGIFLILPEVLSILTLISIGG